jgi:hypothetical protein
MPTLWNPAAACEIRRLMSLVSNVRFPIQIVAIKLRTP